MSKSKHTPGPWHVSQSAARFAVPGNQSPRQNMINARVIASAPDLVDALRLIAGDSAYFGDAAAMQARAALAKAGI